MSKKMLLLLAGAGLALISIVSLLMSGVLATAQETSHTCITNLVVFSDQRGFSNIPTLSGVLSIEIEPSGAVIGNLDQEKDVDMVVVGQVIGRAIHLVFQRNPAAPSEDIFAIGTGVNDIRDCTGDWAGSFVGRHGRTPLDDNGEWWATTELQ